MANLMKSIKSKLLILAFSLLTSCGVQWQVSTLNHTAHDPLYSDFVRQHPEKIDTLSASQFRWKFQNDFRFRSDWKRFAQNQSYSWWSDYYWKNRLWRLGWSSSHQLYVNSFNYLYFNLNEENFGIRKVEKLAKSDYYNFLICTEEKANFLNLI